jgi:MFS family permease
LSDGPGDARIRGDFGRLLAAGTISNFGSMLTGVALPFLAIQLLDASPAQIAAINAAAILPTIVLGLLAADAIDRMYRRRLLIVADLARAALLLAVPAAAFAGVLAMEHLYLFAFARGLLDFVFDVAQHSYLPSLVEVRALVSANSRLQAADAAAEAGAVAAGGWLVQLLSAPLALVVDAATPGVRVLRCASARVEPRPHRAARTPRLAEIGAGPARSRAPHWWRITASASLIALSGQVINAVYMLFVYRELGFSPALGMLFALGSRPRSRAPSPPERLPDATRASRDVRRPGSPPPAPRPSLAPGATLLGVAAIATQQIVGDFGHVLYQIHQTSLRQRIVPSELLGRVGGAIRFLSSVAMLGGTALWGLLGETVGLRPALFSGAALLALAALVVSRARST